MKTEFKHNPSIPYSLHDMRVNKIQVQEDKIILDFENGYVKLTELYEQIDGNITIEGVDFYFTSVTMQSELGSFGRFQGEKMSLVDFIKQYQNYSFEIVDELYGYNQVLYSGYLYTAKIIQMEIAIYFTGNIIYETEE